MRGKVGEFLHRFLHRSVKLYRKHLAFRHVIVGYRAFKK
ncbi:hypothetical protein CKA32_005829 [Geitlerinema sp. FC II]|nr:hypothetical protein CKA32_005829 [Geitlerinema sp. FC II]